MEAFFRENITFAAGSDYGVAKARDKVVENNLRSYDAITAANLQDLSLNLRGEFGSKHPLLQVSSFWWS